MSGAERHPIAVPFAPTLGKTEGLGILDSNGAETRSLVR
jgi:hypothetical protein